MNFPAAGAEIPRPSPLAIRALKSLANLVAFSIALVITSAILFRILPSAPVPQFSAKLAYFAAHKDEFDTLFIGSSRTFRQLLPSVFDPAMAAAGRPTRSFNFGLDSMHAPEDAFVAEQIFALHPQRLRHVVLEVSAMLTDFSAQPEDTRRALHWHDFRRTQLICREIFPRGKKEQTRNPARWIRAFKHARLCAIRALNLGEATRIFDAMRRVPPPAPEWVIGSNGDGAVPYDSETPIAGEDRVNYDRDLAVLAGGKATVHPLAGPALESIEGTIARVRKLGAEPVLFIAPIAATRIIRTTRESAPVLDFSDPQKWPALFDPANRYDRAHLNAPGARLFSRVFAERYLALSQTKN